MAPRKDYKQEQMNSAIKAVRNGQTVLAASKIFGVPRITLRNKMTGKSPLICGMGPPSILSTEQEVMFVEWIHKMSDKQIPVGKEHVIDSVEYFVTQENIVNPFRDNRPGKKWFNSFSKRNPEASKRISENWWKCKDNITEQKIRSWFIQINKYLEKKGLLNLTKDPRRIFTSDEAAFYLNPKHERALVKRNETNIYSAAGNEKEHPKVYLTANAAGELAPPMVVFPDQRFPANVSNIPEEWGVGRSKIGWMSATTLYEYITNVFHPWLIENDIKLPVIYFLDGEATHLTMHLSEFCLQHQIELLSLYPNSNHMLKPMDVAIFRPLKAFWKRQCTIWKIENLGEKINKENFAPILKNALHNITTNCIRNGFKISGLHPFSSKNIDFTKLTAVNRTKALNSFQFLNTLEKEIVLHFTPEKLEAFNSFFNMENDYLENDVPKEDMSLYTIWAKYKHAYRNASTHFVENTAAPLIPKSMKRIRTSSPKCEITTNNETFAEIRRISSENGYNSEEIEGENCEPSYLHLRRDKSDTIACKQLPVTFNKRLSQNTLFLKRQLWSDDEFKQTKRVKKQPTLTIKTWRELNKRQLEKKKMFQHDIKQEPLGTEDLEIQLTQKPKIRQKTVKKRRKILISYQNASETEESVTEFVGEDDEVTDTEHISDINDIIVKKVNKTEEKLEKPLPSVDIENEKLDDDSVIICVKDNDVKILYY